MFTKEGIEQIEQPMLILEEVGIKRRGEVFDLYIFHVLQKAHIFTGNAENVAKYLNEYFDLKEVVR